jgi:hypothetical protein
MAIVYACLVVRSYFLADAYTNMAFTTVMLSRATLCEIMAMKHLTHFASEQKVLVTALTTSWSPLAGAPPEIIADVKRTLGGNENNLDFPQSALEVCINLLIDRCFCSTF